MAVGDLLSRLDKVKPTGRGRWQACCPAHEDRSPSLSITEQPDGRVLVHCHAECPIDAVLGVVGLELSDLYPDKPIEHAKRVRRPYNANDVLRAAAHEALVVTIAASRVAQGAELTAPERERLVTAAARLQRAVEIATDA